MLSLIGDRFLKRFLKGSRYLSKGGSSSEVGTLAESAAERTNRSDDLEQAGTLEKEVDITHKFHHPKGDVNGTPAATQRSDDPQKQTQTK